MGLNTGRMGGYVGLAKVMVAIILCYVAISIVITTKDDFRLVIPYVEFAKQVRGVRPLLLDTSVLIDGRIDGLGQTGFLDAPLVVPQFVIEELQTLADSGTNSSAARGRRGLTLVSKLQANPYVDVSIDTTDIPRRSVDHMLLQLAADQNLRILTTDYNLNKVAQIHGVTVLNINDITNTLKSQAIPGETLLVEVVKHGEGPTRASATCPMAPWSSSKKPQTSRQDRRAHRDQLSADHRRPHDLRQLKLDGEAGHDGSSQVDQSPRPRPISREHRCAQREADHRAPVSSSSESRRNPRR